MRTGPLKTTVRPATVGLFFLRERPPSADIHPPWQDSTQILVRSHRAGLSQSVFMDTAKMGFHCSTCGQFHTEVPMSFSAGMAPTMWLAWVSLSKRSFERAQELWFQEGREAEPAYFGWLQSTLPYEPSTVSLKTRLHTMPVGHRPRIELEPTDRPLAVEQRTGISMSRVHEIVEAAMHC